jgi:hypothetical protein
MENYDGMIGAITVAVLKAGLKPSTAVQLVVSIVAKASFIIRHDG